MNHVSLTSDLRIAPRAARVDTSSPMPFAILHDTHEPPPTTKTAPTPQARGRSVHERVITPTEGLPEFDWVI